MSEPAETPVSPTIEAFTKRIEALSRQHQETAAALCAVRMARDTGLLPKRPPSRPPGMWSWLQEQAAELLDPRPRAIARVRKTTQVIVIDSRSTQARDEEVIDVTARTR